MSLSSISTLLQRATVCGLIGATGFGFVTVGRQVNYIRLQVRCYKTIVVSNVIRRETQGPTPISQQFVFKCDVENSEGVRNVDL